MLLNLTAGGRMVLLVALLCCVPCASYTATAADKPQAFLDGVTAGADFAIQGEYVGKPGDGAIGLQVVALGDGQFDAVSYPGGLPGDGWNSADGKSKLHGAITDGVAQLSGEGISVAIAPDSAVWKQDGKEVELTKEMRKSPTFGQAPPPGAVVLFDGSTVDAWDPGKKVDGNLMGVGTRTREQFANYTLHLEFRTPFMPRARGQGRGNSGLYVGDQYEIQILDSFGLEGENNECGGLYQNAKPAVNMALPPLSWQTYDAEMTAATVGDDGKVTEPARLTLRHNGVVIHENIALKVTPGGGRNDERAGSVYLQDHGDPVRFKNIWLLPKP